MVLGGACAAEELGGDPTGREEEPDDPAPRQPDGRDARADGSPSRPVDRGPGIVDAVSMADAVSKDDVGARTDGATESDSADIPGEATDGPPVAAPTGHPLGGKSRVKARLVKDGLGFTEGPVWVARGPFVEAPALLFTSSRTITRLVLPDTITPVEPNAGANGLAIDGEGRLYACRGGRVTRTTPDGKVDKTWSGFGNANDVIVREDGTVYVTNFQNSPGVLRIPPGGNPVAVAGSDSNSNGIALSPDGRTLYVVISSTARRVDRLTLAADGTPGRPSPLARLTGIWADGMAVDDAGNLYVTSSIDNRVGIVEVFSPDGKLLGTIDVGPKVTNCTFGGPDRKTLFITASRSAWAADLEIPGKP